jgi:hypothetical protein
MPNIFDGMQDRLFDLTTTTFGYDASWAPSDESDPQAGRVNYRRPNEKDTIANGVDYMPFAYFMEYKEGVFSGLQEAVRSGSIETVIINGVSHYVRSVHRVYDGKTFQAHLERID